MTDIIHTVVIDEANENQRLDRALAALVPSLTRSRLQGLLASGHVAHNGLPFDDASKRVHIGEHYTIALPEAAPATPLAETLPLTIVYEDDSLLVIDKAAGMTVHPAPGHSHGTLVNALLGLCGASLSGIGGVKRPGIVHRLDKETSGLMVVAKTDVAHLGLSKQLASRSLSRVYQAVVWGMPEPRQGLIDKPIGRSATNRKKMAVVAGGKPAQTAYTVLKPLGLKAALIECRLQTGRTHQIRVHMTSIGHPLVGDPVYGKANLAPLRKTYPALVGFGRQALHAAEIGFVHPVSGVSLHFTSPLPDDIKTLVALAESG